MHTENVTIYANEDAKNILASQVSRLWTELVTRRLRVEGIEAAGFIARAAERIGKVREGALMLIIPLCRFPNPWDP